MTRVVEQPRAATGQERVKLTYRFINGTKLLELLAQSALIRMPCKATATSVSVGVAGVSATRWPHSSTCVRWASAWSMEDEEEGGGRVAGRERRGEKEGGGGGRAERRLTLQRASPWRMKQYDVAEMTCLSDAFSTRDRFDGLETRRRCKVVKEVVDCDDGAWWCEQREKLAGQEWDASWVRQGYHQHTGQDGTHYLEWAKQRSAYVKSIRGASHSVGTG